MDTQTIIAVASVGLFLIAFISAIIGGVWALHKTIDTKLDRIYDRLEKMEARLNEKLDRLRQDHEDLKSDVKNIKSSDVD